jgi:hypothetical protein
MPTNAQTVFGVLILSSSLGGCFSSDYDVSQQIRPVFPVEPGFFREIQPSKLSPHPSEAIAVTRTDDIYQAVDVKNAGPSLFFRFFRIPGVEPYLLVQEWEENHPDQYVYLYGKASSDNVDLFIVVLKSKDDLPDDIKDRLSFNSRGPSVVNSQDIFNVARAIILHRPKLEPLGSYERFR